MVATAIDPYPSLSSMIPMATASTRCLVWVEASVPEGGLLTAPTLTLSREEVVALADGSPRGSLEG
jgi:hypothetical protein